MRSIAFIGGGKMAAAIAGGIGGKSVTRTAAGVTMAPPDDLFDPLDITRRDRAVGLEEA